MLEALIFVVFPFCMVFAAISDMLSMTIANRVAIVLVGDFRGRGSPDRHGLDDLCLALRGVLHRPAGYLSPLRSWAAWAAATPLHGCDRPLHGHEHPARSVSGDLRLHRRAC